MADFFQKSVKKQNDTERFVELSTIFNDTPTSVNLCEKLQLSKSLVNWCRDHKEDCLRTESTEAAKLCGEFPSCLSIELHQSLFNSFPNTRREIIQRRSNRSKVNVKRNNKLLYFVGESVQLKKNIEDSVENKEQAQIQNSNAAAPTLGSKKSFTNRFKHFTDPEDVISEYINVHVYNRTRLGKVDKKKVFLSIIALRNIQKENAAELLDKAETVGIFHNEKTSKNLLKLERSLPTIKLVEDRSMATKNFIFQLGALDDAKFQNNRNRQMPSINAKLRDEKKRMLLKTQNSASLLPKLHFTELQAIDIGNQEVKTILSKKKILPDIHRRKNLNHEKEDTRRSRVDGRSNWELIKQRRNLTGGRVTDGPGSKDLFYKLEEMKTQISKMPDLYSGRKIDNCCLKSGFNVLKKGPGVIFDNKDVKQKKSQFSEEIRAQETNPNTVSSNCLNEKIEDHRNLRKNCMKSSNKRAGSKSSSKNEKTLPKFKKQEIEEPKSEVEKYLEKYSTILNKNTSNDEPETAVSYPSSETVADMLARLNIHDFGFHINAKKGEKLINNITTVEKQKDFRIQNANLTANNYCHNFKIDNISKTGRGSESILIKEHCSKLSTVEQSSETNRADRTTVKSVNNGNAFVKMGLNSLTAKIPEHLHSHILKSDFLNRDLSFKSPYVFKNSANFKNILNSCISFNLNSPMSDKWLLKKIQAVVISQSSHNYLKGKSRSIAKLCETVEKKLIGLESKKNIKATKTKQQSFVQKFLEVHNNILEDPRLKEILPGLVYSVQNFAKIQTR